MIYAEKKDEGGQVVGRAWFFSVREFAPYFAQGYRSDEKTNDERAVRWLTSSEGEKARLRGELPADVSERRWDV